MRRRPLSAAVAAVLSFGLVAAVPAAHAETPSPAQTAPAAQDPGVFPYSMLPGFDPLKPSSTPVDLPGAPRDLKVTYTVDGQTKTLEDYLSRTAQGFVVLDGGKIVKEWYAGGYSKDSLFQSWSMAKSYTSNAVGVALGEGKIKSLDDTVATYVPELAKSAYGPLKLYDLLRMGSGIKWNEVGDVPVFHVGNSMGWWSTRDFASWREKEVAPGTRFNYASMDSAVLALVVQKATGKKYFQYLAEKIWEPGGMATYGYVGNDSRGNGLGYCCVYTSTRNFARYGQLMLNDGKVGGRQVVPSSWVKQATTTSGINKQYGLHWWIDPGEGYYASGLGDQLIYVSTKHNVVIARNTAFNPAQNETLPALRAVAAEVARTR